MGTNSRNAMHDIAYKEAVDKGPQIVRLDDIEVAAYALSKHELARLFEMNNWSSDRISWLKCIRSWREFHNDIAPKDETLYKPGAEWIVVFRTCGADEYHVLDRFAVAHRIQAYNVAPEFNVSLDNIRGGVTA